MIRHLAELGALLLCFAVGVGLVGAFFVGLAWIWSPTVSEEGGAREEEYRRVESAGRYVLPARFTIGPITFGEPRALPFEAYVPPASRPYNWATREPMVWNLGEPIDESAEFNALLRRMRHHG